MVDRPGRTLVVTNDFPPRRGGIESFVQALCDRLPADEVVVYTAAMPGAATVDRAMGYPVVRDRSRILLPTPRVRRSVLAIAEQHGCDRVLFGASAPLGLLAGALGAAGIRRSVALTHGHEVWWAAVPGARGALRRIGRRVDVLTYVSDYCRDRIGTALRAEDAAAMVRLSPGVDGSVFAGSTDRARWRRRLGIEPDGPLVLAASRLVARKGHDTLINGWPRVLRGSPDARLLIVGDGPSRHRLAAAMRRDGLTAAVTLMPSVPWSEMPALYRAADVFALPCRTRLWGLEPEAFGIVFLEAAASGLPVVVGASGGAPESGVNGETGYLVDPRSPSDVADRILDLLTDPARAQEMGRRGRARVLERYSWERAVAVLAELLA